MWRLFRRRTSLSGEQSRNEASGRQSGNATATGNAAATGNVLTVNFAVTPPVVDKPPDTPPKVPRTSNVSCIGVRTINLLINYDQYGRAMFLETNRKTNAVALVATFRNDPEYGKAYRDAENVSAHLKLRDEDAKEVGTGISRACWLDNQSDMVDIRIAETQNLILLILDDYGKETIPYKKDAPPKCLVKPSPTV